MWSELFAGLSAATLVALWSGAVAGAKKADAGDPSEAKAIPVAAK